MAASSSCLQDELYKIPFDMFQRYKIAAELLNAVRSKAQLTVLDVGGWPGLMQKLLPSDRLVVLDLQETRGVEALIGEATAIPFTSGSFDLVLAIDIMEHLPAGHRQRFLEELLRVTGGYLILAGPFSEPDVDYAERTLNDFAARVLGVRNRFLEEHIANGLPDIEEVRRYFREVQLVPVEVPNGYLYHWIVMMMANHFIESFIRNRAFHEWVNESYNRGSYVSDNREPCYRRVFVVSKNSKLNGELIMNRIGLKQPPYPSRLDSTVKPEVVELLFKVIEQAIAHQAEIIKSRDEGIAYQAQTIDDLRKIIKSRDEEIADLRESLPVRLWLASIGFLKKRVLRTEISDH